MADSSHYSFEQYREARITIATIEAEIWWRQNVENSQPVARPVAGDVAAISAGNAAKFLSISKSTFYELVRAGAIPKGFAVGGRRKWLRSDLEKYLAKQKRKGPT